MHVLKKDVDLLQLDNEILEVLASLSGVKGEGGLVDGGLGAGAPVVDQVADLGTLEGVRGEETSWLRGGIKTSIRSRSTEVHKTRNENI